MNWWKTAWWNTFDIRTLEPSVVVKEYTKFYEGEVKHVLDVGCGNFRNSLYFASQWAEVDAIDIADTSYKLESLPQELKDKIKFLVSDVSSLTESKSYQIVVAARLIQYLRREQIERFFTYIQSSLEHNWLLLLSFTSSWGIFNKEGIDVPKYRYSKEEIINLWTESGLQLLRMSNWNTVSTHVNYEEAVSSYDMILRKPA